MSDPGGKGHALRWLRAQSQPDKRDFVISLAKSNLHLAMEAVQRVELCGDYLVDAIKPCLDADIVALRVWLTFVLRILGTDRYLVLVEHLIDTYPARACRAMHWLEPKLRDLNLFKYHERTLDRLSDKFASVDRPDDILDWVYGRGDSTGAPPVT